MRELNRFESWAEIESLAAGTPAIAVVDAVGRRRPTPPPSPTGRPMRQRVNIGLVTIFSQAIQITFVGLALTGFFVLFGFLAIPEATAAAWTTLDPVARPRPTGRSAGARS